MKTNLLLAAAVILATAACGGSEATGGASSGTGAGSSSSTNTSTATGASTSTGGPGISVTIEMTNFDVQPGEEVYKCQNFANPFNGNTEIGGFESHMTAGSHHLLLFYKGGAKNGPIETFAFKRAKP